MVGQLVRENARKRCPIQHMVLALNLATDNTLNFPSTDCFGPVSILRLVSPWKVQGLDHKISLVINKPKRGECDLLILHLLY